MAAAAPTRPRLSASPGRKYYTRETRSAALRQEPGPGNEGSPRRATAHGQGADRARDARRRRSRPATPPATTRRVVPTDTMKNIVNVLAHEHLGHETEPFAAAPRRPHARALRPGDARQRRDRRAGVDAARSSKARRMPHSFVQRDRAHAVRAPRGPTGGRTRPAARLLESGMRDLVLLKSTASGFEGFPRCEHTTLPETADRILASAITATWRWREAPGQLRRRQRQSSRAPWPCPSPRATVPRCRRRCSRWAAPRSRPAPEIEAITLAMPNLHCLRIDLSPFGQQERQRPVRAH